METNFNLGSLKIVQAPLMEYFKKSLANVEANLIAVRDEKKIPTNHEAIEILVKVQKTLDMIGLKGLSKVLSITEEGLNAVKEVRFDSKRHTEILEVTAQIIKNSSLYIQRLVASGTDQPKQFFSDYQKISTILGKDAQIKDLFFPKLELNPEVNEQIQSDLRSGVFINENSKKNLVLHLEKSHSIIQSKLLTVFGALDAYGEFETIEEKNNYQNVCKQLYEAFDYAQKLKLNKNFFILFGVYKLYICVLSPVFNEDFSRYVNDKQASIKTTISKIERVVARLIQNIKEMEIGDKTGNVRLDDEIVKEIIFELVHVVNSNQKLKEMPVYKELAEYFDLDYYAEQLDSSNIEVESNASFSSEDMEETDKLFVDLKEEFNILCSKKEGTDEFANNTAKVINTTNKLIENSSTDIKPILTEIVNALSLVKSHKLSFDSNLQREISLALVLTEYGINSFMKQVVESRKKKDYIAQIELQVNRIKAVCKKDLDKLSTLEMPKIDLVSQKSDEKKTFVKIFSKLKEDLTKIEETLDYYLKNEGENASDIEAIYKPLVGMKGLFAIAGKADLGKVINKIAEPWKRIIDNGPESVLREELNESISLLGGLSLLIKALVADNETTADELYDNLMKMFYQNNALEMEQDTLVAEFIEEGSENNPPPVVETTPVVEAVEDDGFEFNFEIEETNDQQPISFSTEESFTPTEPSISLENDKVEVEVFSFATDTDTDNATIPSSNVTYTEGTNDPDLAEVFLMEAEEVLENMRSSFDILENDLQNNDEITNLKRYFHTLKGSGRMVGLEFMGEAAWMAEQTLNKCVSGEMVFDQEVLNCTKDLKNRFTFWVDDLKSTNQVTVDLVSVKKQFIAINPEITNHIDISLDTVDAEVSKEDSGLSLDLDTNEFNFDMSEDKKEESPLSFADENFSFELPTEVVAEEKKEESPLSFTDENFSFELPTEAAIEEKKEETSVEFTTDNFNFEIPTEQVTEELKEETSVEFTTDNFNFELPTETEAVIVEEKIEEPLIEDNFNFELPTEAVAEEVKVEITEDNFSFELPVEATKEETNDTIYINGKPVATELYDLYKLESASHIDSLKQEAYAESVQDVLLSDDFMRHAHTLCSISRSVYLEDLGNLAKRLEEVALNAIDKNVYLNQFQMSLVREVVEIFEAYQDLDLNKHPANAGMLIEKLNELNDEINVAAESSKDIEINTQSNFDTEEFRQDLLQEVETLVGEHNKKLLEDVIHSGFVKKDFVAELIKKIDTLEKNLEDVQTNSEEKDKDFNSKLKEMQEAQEERERLYNKALEVTKNDIRSLAHIIKKKYEVANQAILQESNGEEVISNGLESDDSKPTPDITEIMAEYSAEVKNLTNIVEEVEVKVAITKEDIEQVDTLLNNMGDTKDSMSLNEADLKIKKLLDTHNFILTVFEDKVASVQDEIDVDIYEISKEEAQEMFDNITPLIEQINESGLSEEDSKGLKRHLHTLKGSLRMAGANKIGMLAHRLESLLDYIENRKINLFDFKPLLEKEMDKVSFLMKDPTQALDIKKVTWLDQIIDESITSTSTFESATPTNNVISVELSVEDAQIKELLNEYTFIHTVFEDKVSAVQDEIDTDIYEISKEEAQEMFDSVTPLVEQINESGLSEEESKALKRHLHTLKGSVRMAGANKIGMLAHRLESLLDYIENRKINLFGFKPLLEKEINKIAFLMKDPTQELDAYKTTWLDEVINPAAMISSTTSIKSEDVEGKSEVVEKIQHAKIEGKKEIKQYIKISSDIVDSAINDAGEIRLSRSSLEDTTSNTKKSISELKNSSGKLLKMVKEVEVQAETQIQAHTTQLDENDSNFDPLEFDRFTRMQELTRLMVEAVADIDETITSLAGTAKIQDNAINTQSIITNNLLSQLLKVRLVPVQTVSERFYKIARNTSKELGKRVSLEILGEKTEIDKLILDKVISPIEHLLRNSIAHGIEMPEKRLEMGKQPVGKIKLEVALEGNFTTIRIKDDGAGINVDKIKEIALKKAMIKENEEYTKDEIINLIFQSGFSTADSVSQVAGRGVGMDVVKNDILAVGGTIKIDTEKNQGSTFTLTLPMEVATTQAMLCTVKDKLVAIPAILIEEVDSIKELQIKEAYRTSKFTINGTSYPFYYAGGLLGLVGAHTVPEAKLYNNIVRVNYMGESIVIHVDKLVTTTEILIKNLGTIYSKITGLLGVTVLGDGRQGVVINPIQLLEHYNKNLNKVNMDIRIDSEKESASTKITVLVVDDSITVRRASSKMLERNNFNVVLAKDGEDALEQLQIHSPNIILSDIEMPRMDGFEFVKNVRSIDKYSHIPIIMITSRTAEKHQKRAFELGANDFLGKPYKEEELIEKIQSLLEYNKELV
jgi:chemotaxis protein histidine kinase CheA/CheY-like chemotaxis protein